MRLLTAVLLLLLTSSISAQTLFQYGNEQVKAEEFLKAYNKNNTGVRSEKALREYLDLYIASRLKVREAMELGYDTMPQIRADLQNLRSQIIHAYINDPETLNRLVNEAFTRSQKNVRIAHIFIKHTGDIRADEQKKEAVLAALKKQDFGDVARKYSDDPSAKTNGGDIGWIAAFTLPYALENLAYSTPVGGHSAFYTSKSGYHLFRNLGERRDPGRMQAAQVLLAFPPEADATIKAAIKLRADSIFERLKKGDDFTKLATAFSNDVISAAANGQMQEFGAGQYDPVFEQAVFALQADGAITKPFETAYGYHIVKRLSKKPAATVMTDALFETFKEKVLQSDRINTIRQAQAEQVRNEAGFKNLALVSSNQLYQYTDSVMLGRFSGEPNPVTHKTPLLQIGKEQINVKAWLDYVQVNRYRQDGGTIPHQELWPRFVDAMSLKYYEDHLEDYNEGFRQQLAEFREGNLFFEIMQNKVWGPAQTDSAALLQYFQEHRSAYKWKPSADAVMFYVTDPSVTKTFIAALKKAPRNWNELTFQYSSSVAADSARVELWQIPNPTKLTLKPGTITSPVTNENDNTTSFALIIRNYTSTEPRSFEQARGLVINDYQQELEKKWISELHKKYPVKVDQSVLEELIKAKRY